MASTRDLALFLGGFIAACVSCGLVLSELFARRETAIQALLWTSMPALFLAGFAWPVEAIPAPLRALAVALPSTAAIPGLLRLTQMGAGLSDVEGEAMTLAALAAVYLALAALLESRRARKSRQD